MICDPEGHRRGHPQRLVRAAQIVKRNVQAHGRKVAIQLLAKAIAEPRKPLRAHPQGEVLPLNVAG
jgi:hypothetical protein